ncbi:amidophosphoribosyltransferase [Halanaerobaculum tunisiense]
MTRNHSCQGGNLIDKMEEECGVFGVYSTSQAEVDVANLTYLGLHALQHRGQESAGICVNDRGEFTNYRGMDLVTNVFDEETLEELTGQMAVGHVRYSTTGSSLLSNAQPLVTNSIKGELALAHNGNLVNGLEMRENLEERGSIFHSTLDTEVIAHLVARSFKDDIVEALTHSLQKVTGAFSLVAMTEDKLVAARDPHGFRPLAIGKIGDSYIVASETCAFDIIGAEHIRDVEPGELIIISDEGIESKYYGERTSYNFCVFEFIYFARPDSVIGEQNVQLARKEIGRQLAKETDIEADLVVPVPSSGIPSALGFAEEAGIEYKKGILRNKYVGRTFIQPTQEIRDLKVRIKLNPIRDIIEGKRIILIDDSIVRGTTSQQIIRMMREAGAKEVHLGIASPPVAYPCYYGLDTSRRQELIAAENSVEEICEHIDADSLNYVTKEGLLDSISANGYGFCTACFDGDYPVGEGADKFSLEE